MLRASATAVGHANFTSVVATAWADHSAAGGSATPAPSAAVRLVPCRSVQMVKGWRSAAIAYTLCWSAMPWEIEIEPEVQGWLGGLDDDDFAQAAARSSGRAGQRHADAPQSIPGRGTVRAAIRLRGRRS